MKEFETRNGFKCREYFDAETSSSGIEVVDPYGDKYDLSGYTLEGFTYNGEVDEKELEEAVYEYGEAY